MKNAKIVAEWDDNKGGAVIEIEGKTSDVYALLCAAVTQFFDAFGLPDSVGLATLARGIEGARKAMLARVDMDALRREMEQDHE